MSPPAERLSARAICGVFCWLACGAATLKLPGTVYRARYERGLILTIEAGPVAVVRDRAGKELFRSEKARENGVYELRDLALCGPRCLAVSVFQAPAPGKGASAIHYYDVDAPGKAPRVVPTGDRNCRRLAGEPGGGLWCLGPDLRKQATGRDYPLLTRLTPEGKLAGEFLPSGPSSEPFRRSNYGEPALLCAKNGEAVVWLPATLTIATAGAASATPIELPARLIGRSRPSFAVTVSGILFALFPHLMPDQAETLATPYQLFRQVPSSNRWTAIPSFGERPRGTELIGWEGDELVLWNRTLREIEWAAVRE